MNLLPIAIIIPQCMHFECTVALCVQLCAAASSTLLIIAVNLTTIILLSTK